MRKISLLSLFLILLSFSIIFLQKTTSTYHSQLIVPEDTFFSSSPTPAVVPTSTPVPLPARKYLDNDYHVFQTFNNCGPTSLSMALSYYNVNISQEELGRQLRPYQNPNGDNDDKSVTLSELADKAQEFGFSSFYRPNGDIEKIKMFVANDFPVVTRTLTKLGEDIGHYRVIKGYDENSDEFIQDDSLQGKNLRYSYNEFNDLWKAFNYEYLVLSLPEKAGVIENILGKDVDKTVAWEKAADLSREQIAQNPNDIYARFNLSVALYNTGDYEASTKVFEKVENLLSFRTLWYNIEPILSYYELGDYDKVLELTEKILNKHNRAFSELYLIRGEIFKKQGNISAARNEFEKAVYYNVNSQKAKEALENI